ncbi:DEAD/DEAH box helicase family protein [Streptomyces flaveolus]|uniref:DEAD/DEAH box helicase family protein n=1 Tax=Streptomyces flaveolus TaxID=67297 RepID=UPI0036FE1248
MSTTDPHALGGLMSVVGEGQDQIPALTVICTYDSLDKIEATQRSGFEVPAFDLAVMDEAHRIAGRADKKWTIANDAQRIRAEPLYMTATPRIFAAPELAESADTTRPRHGDGHGRLRQLHKQRGRLGQEGHRAPARAGNGGPAALRTTASWSPP